MKQYALPLVGLASLAASQSLYTCSGLTWPNWDHCDSLMATLGWENAATAVVTNEEGGACSNICKSFWLTGDNCLFSVCFYQESCAEELQRSLYAVYDNILKRWCQPADSGGTYGPFGSSNDREFHVTNNPDYTGSRQLLLEQYAFSNRTFGNGVVEYDLTIEDMEIVLEAAAAATVAVEGKDGEEKEKKKRQEDGDDFHLIAVEYARARPGNEWRMEVAIRVSPGVELTWTQSETTTVSVGMSVEVGVSLFEIFTASAGIETSMEHSETIQSSITMTPGDCPASANVYYYPMYDRYIGTWSSSDEEWEAWIPVARDGFAAGFFDTECTGSS